MEFNLLTMNGKVGPAISPLLAGWANRVRIRFVNLGRTQHNAHDGHQFVVHGHRGRPGARVAVASHEHGAVGVSQARNVEFEATQWGTGCSTATCRTT